MVGDCLFSSEAKLWSREELCEVSVLSLLPLDHTLLSYNVIHSSITHQPFYLTDTFTCKSTSLIYCIICSKCSKMYVGQTSKSLLNRFGHHKSTAKEKRKSTWPIYRHFSCRGHNFETHARILPLEHCPPNQLSREIHWIRALNTVLPFGLHSQYSKLSSFHVSSLVRQPWYIKTNLTVTSNLLKKTRPKVEILRLTLFKPLGCLLLKCLL